MATKRRNLFLYLTLVCFFGLIAVFIVDGYLGIYDTLTMTAGEWEQRIYSDQWPEEERGWKQSINVGWGDKAFFTYEVDNRQFSGYTADVDVSVWQSQEKVSSVLSELMVLDSFAEAKLEWVIDTSELLPEDAPSEQGYQYTVVIKRGDIEREIVLYVNPYFAPKPVPPVPR